MTFETGEDLVELAEAGLILYLDVTTAHSQVSTSNVIATSRLGDPDHTIVVGSHLDSVPAGPGIDDNGSGSAVNLELAVRFAAYSARKAPTNMVRFCWWAAEEVGLVGSQYYVDNLTPAELAATAVNLNFDMLGAPNYIRYIYNGSNAALEPIRGPSMNVTNIFADYFNQSGLPYELTAFTGRSDYGPFIAVGIPAGGLATGAEELKTITQRQIFGGIANAQLDTCYHDACDDLANINWDIMSQNAKAAAYALQSLAYGNLTQILGTRSARVSLAWVDRAKVCVSNFPCQ